MFHPSANRLAGFLEVSALSIALSQSGGWQAKAGMLRIDTTNSKAGNFGRKGASWTERKKQRWCCVRDGYLVAMEELGELKVWDVFLFDTDFKIERPMRYYRQGWNMLHPDADETEEIKRDGPHMKVEGHMAQEGHGTLRAVRSRLGKVFHVGRHNRSDRHSTSGASLRHRRSQGSHQGAEDSGSDSDSSDSRPSTPIADPSTNVNAMDGEQDANRQLDKTNDSTKRKKKKSSDVSKHTFFISNSQMKLKLFARNQVN